MDSIGKKAGMVAAFLWENAIDAGKTLHHYPEKIKGGLIAILLKQGQFSQQKVGLSYQLESSCWARVEDGP